MEGKKDKKINVLAVFCTILIVVIIALVGYIFVQKTNYDKEIKGLELNNVKMKSTIDDLQEKVVLMEETNNTVSTQNTTNTTNTVDDADNEMNDEEVDKIAEELFEKGSQKVRETIYSGYDEYDLIIPSSEEVLNGKVYERRDAFYSDVEEEYAKIFTDEALKAVLEERFTEVDGYLYVLEGGTTGWDISNIKLERTKESENEIEYSITYNDVEIDGSVSEEITCSMTIKLVDGEYRISKTDYCELM